jgi:hypothetical protein
VLDRRWLAAVVYAAVGGLVAYVVTARTYERQLRDAEGRADRYRNAAEAVDPAGAELIALSNVEVKARARRAAERLNALRGTFQQAIEPARTEVIAGRIDGDTFEAIRMRAEQAALDGFTKNVRVEAVALRDELHSRLTPDARSQLAASILNLATQPAVPRAQQMLFMEMLAKDLADASDALPDQAALPQ